MKTGAKSALFCALATVGIVCLPLGQAQAQTVFGTIQAFGDSYADIGNLFKVIGPSPFYPTGRPILPVPWATVWILGTAYVAWRIGDARFAILGAWLIAGLAGAALTNDTPALQRVAGMVPTLALIPALFVERVVSIGSRQPRAGRESASVFERPVLVIGNAPTALNEALRLVSEGWRPRAIIGMPVGFVGVEEAKQRLLDQSIVPYLTCVGRKGGSAVAAAAMNALIECFKSSSSTGVR